MVDQGTDFVMDSSKPQGPGACLRLQREVKNRDFDEVAKLLRLSPVRLAQIEEDNYTNMGAPAFARGYLRSYARILHLQEEEIRKILSLFDEQNLGSTIPANKPTLLHEKISTATPKATRRLGYLILAILIALVAFWWHSRSNQAADKNVTAAMNVTGPQSAAAQNPVQDNSNGQNGSEKAILQTVPLQSGSSASDPNKVESASSAPISGTSSPITIGNPSVPATSSAILRVSN